MLPVYKSDATNEEREQNLKFMHKQIIAIKQQDSWDMSAAKTTIKCVCDKKIKLIYAYKCLYCGIWYCKECAEMHFGAKTEQTE